MSEHTSKSDHQKLKSRSPWFWVPSLYYAEGIPYIVAMTVSVIFYKKMGISNTKIALYTSWLYLPWVIKPLWSPVVDIFRTKRFWIIFMQLIIGGGMASVALTIPLPNYFQLTLAFFWLLAFSSATHDIAADGFYMLGLDQHRQAWFVGVRSTFYRFAMLTGQGLLVILAGYIESHTGLPSVKLPVTAVQTMEISTRFVPPDSLVIKEETGPLHIGMFPQKLEIPLQKRRAAEIEKIVQKVDRWKAGNHVDFGDLFSAPEHNDNRNAGNIGLVYFYLSAPPPENEKIVVNFGRDAGNRSISLLAGGRFEFNATNWNRPQLAVIQLDHKLKSKTQASFLATSGNVPLSWIVTFSFIAILFFILFVYHKFMLPHPREDAPRRPKAFLKEYGNTFALFFKKKHIGFALAFLLLYRLAESQLVKLASPFLLDTQDMGGLALTTGQLGFVYGTVGLLMLTIGGLLGGFIAARDGLKKWLWVMVIAINLPDAVYVYLAYYQPDSLWIINLCVGIEQFGYGLGFTAYMLYMIYVSEGEYKTAHFAIATGFMALGMMLPGMVSGYIQEWLGYGHFFIWVLICAIPGFFLVKFLPIDPEFGKKKEVPSGS